MAYTQTMSPQSVHQHYRDVQAPTTPPMQRRGLAVRMRFVADLSQCLFDFVIQLLPTAEEMAVKEDVRKLLERLIRTIEPDSRLLSFGSTANGFSLRNSDMDLCCLIDSKERLAATDLVTMLGDLLERETKFHVKPLPHARIPIVKLSLDPSPGLPLGIACDIGFENRLALENTRLLMCYAMIDPTRVRTMVLFLKVWSKRRKINSPYKGTLSSYGYVLLVIYFLVHVKNPPVLPNLQQMPPLRPITTEDTHLAGYNTWFFDDIELLRQRWHSDNTETVAELLIDFFRYYSRDFPYNTGVASIRTGLLKKELKGWQNDLSGGRYNDSRERNRLCIEDPFETDYNVARCVTKDGLYTIRGEFMRAARVLSTRPERAIIALAELCEERKVEDLVSAPPYASSRASLPPQTPYTVGSQSMRPKGAPAPERLSPPTKFFEPGPRTVVSIRPPPPDYVPEHMAPKRSKWTSPPPVEAPSADHSLFESQLGIGLELATSSTEAREKEGNAYNSSSSNSEFLTDEDTRSDTAESDDVTSVRSYTEGSTVNGPGSQRRPSWHVRDTAVRVPQVLPFSQGRGRYPPRVVDSPPGPIHRPSLSPATLSSARGEQHRPGLSSSRPPRATSHTPIGVSVPLPPSPNSPLHSHPPTFTEATNTHNNTVFYQTTAPCSPRPNVLYPTPGPQLSLLAQYQSPSLSNNAHDRANIHAQPYFTYSPGHGHNSTTDPGLRNAYSNIITNTVTENVDENIPRDIFPAHMPALTSIRGERDPRRSSSGPDTPTPGSYSHVYSARHGHSQSTTTVTAHTPPPQLVGFASTSSNAPSPTIPGLGPGRPSPNSTGFTLTSSDTARRISQRYDQASASEFGLTAAAARSRSGSPTRSHPHPHLHQPALLVHDLPSQSDIRTPLGRGHGQFIVPPHHGNRHEGSTGGSSPHSTGSSPTPSSTGYATSLSRSPSPSPSPPPTAVPIRLRADEGDGGEKGEDVVKEVGVTIGIGNERSEELGEKVFVAHESEVQEVEIHPSGVHGDGDESNSRPQNGSTGA